MDELDMTFGALIARAGAKADPSGGFQRSVFTEKGVMDERPATIVPTTTSMSALATYATRTFMTNASHRRSSGVDAKLRYCISAQTCEYTDEQKRMFEVRPGITGWAQTHGRKHVEWHKRIELNVWYVDHVSLWTDIQVIWITVMKVLKRADINEVGQATMEEFNGHN